MQHLRSPVECKSSLENNEVVTEPVSMQLGNDGCLNVLSYLPPNMRKGGKGRGGGKLISRFSWW